jgi:4-amino-4-deoxy-L-arabinose transferase-like glycosyltransferase
MRAKMTPQFSAHPIRPADGAAAPPAVVGGLHRGVWFAVAVVMTIVWFALLDTRKLQHPDEGRYAEIAREMQASGDWVTPRLNGLKYFEKPPLQYWLTAASYAAFELDEWTARLPVALAGWLAVFAIGFAGMRIASPTVGAYAAVVLAGTVWHFGLAHMVTLDSLLSACLAAALAAFLAAQRDAASPRERRTLMLLAWAAIAGAVLTKGLVGLLIPGASIVIYSLVTRDFAVWRRLELLRGGALALVLAAPWFIVVSSRNPEFARFFFIHEHFERFLTQEHRRVGAWWYFVPLLAIGLLPWVGAFVWTLKRSWRDAPSDRNGFSWPRFCLVWIAFVFVFFSASGSKLPSYILPLFPAAALVIGWQLTRLDARTLWRLVFLLAAGGWVLLAGIWLSWDALVARVADASTLADVCARLHPWFVAGLAVAALGYSAAAWALSRPGEARRTTAIVGVSLATMVTMQLLLCGNDAFRATRSAADLVTILENETQPPFDADAPVFQVGLYDQTLPFYLRRTTTLVHYRDELGLGLDAEPAKGIPRDADWIAQWQSLAQGYALIGPDTMAALSKLDVPFRIIARDPRRILIARR